MSSSLPTTNFERSSTICAAGIVYINTWSTTRIPWNVAVFMDDIIVGLAPYNESIRFINRVKEMVLKLPVRISLPDPCTDLSFPRYYAIFTKKDAIEDVVGVRSDLSPTKWSYRFGYWHPIAQHKIARAINREIRSITETLSERIFKT